MGRMKLLAATALCVGLCGWMSVKDTGTGQQTNRPLPPIVEDPTEHITDAIPLANLEGIKGSLVIVGGGEVPDSVRQRFIALAGGEKAKIVVIPTASELAEALLADEEQTEALLAPWKALGVTDVRAFHTRSADSANDEKFIEPLRQATGIWIESGQQANIAQAYLGTAVEKELYSLLQRGGVIGGTSAGAAIQSRVMIAGGSSEPVMATGLDLLPGSIVDQHFMNRNRKPRLMKAISDHPGLVGFGIDESTALIVQGSMLEVLGGGDVTVMLPTPRSDDEAVQEFDLRTGSVNDLGLLRRAATDGIALVLAKVEQPLSRPVTGVILPEEDGELLPGVETNLDRINQMIDRILSMFDGLPGIGSEDKEPVP